MGLLQVINYFLTNFMNIQAISWKKAVLALALVATVATAGFLSTRAFFSDTETSAANVFSAGSLNLKVGINALGSTWPVVEPRDNNNQQLFALGGLMPGQVGTGELRLLSEGGDAWACVSAQITDTPENTHLSQEWSSGDNSGWANGGELQDYMEIAIWEANGLSNANGIVGPNEKETLKVMSLEEFANGNYKTLQDSSANGGDNPLVAGAEYKHEFAYCFGEFSNVPAVTAAGGTLECSGNVAGVNQAQTDGVEVLLNFYAEQRTNNEDFTCSSMNAALPGTINTVTAEYVQNNAVGETYKGVYVGFNEVDVVNATAVELRLNLSNNTTLSTFAKPSVLTAVNASGAAYSTGGTVIVTGSRTSGSWDPQTAPVPAIPSGVTVNNVEVLITLSNDTVITQTLDETGITNQALGDVIFN